MDKIVEICCGSYSDALSAFNGGAKRIELNSALSLGGLTPSLGSLIETKQNTNLKVICMLRNRAGGFNYNDDEFKTMLCDCKALLENGADGISFGILNNSYELDYEKCKVIIDLVKTYHKEVVFHRAFDLVNDPYTTIEELIKLKVDRVLTSGQKENAIKGKELIKELQNKYGDKIQILAGCGINSDNAKELIEYTGISQIHSSCKDMAIDITASNTNVSFDYLTNNEHEIVSKDKVVKLINSVK